MPDDKPASISISAALQYAPGLGGFPDRVTLGGDRACGGRRCRPAGCFPVFVVALKHAMGYHRPIIFREIDAMIERELKLHVPAGARAGIARELRAQKARRITLQARYFDTPGRDLAAANIALRLRKEGRRWVQTIKAPAGDTLSRIEINHVRPSPELDITLYAGTALEAFFSGLKAPLTLRYETRVTRQVLEIHHNEAVVELAYDQGALYAGEAELPISELEFEQVSGDPDAIFQVGREWLVRHGLVIDLRSKAERGDALANRALSIVAGPDGLVNLATVAQPAVHTLFKAVRAAPVTLKPRMPVEQAYVVSASECLFQIIQNTAFAAGADTAQAGHDAHMEYVHQLRVGIRRLRSCWKLFRGWVPEAPAEATAVLRQSFGAFGNSRDLDVVTKVVAPRIKAHGLPDCSFPRRRKAADQDQDAVAAHPDFQLALLAFLQQLIQLGDAVAQAARADTPDLALPAGSPGSADLVPVPASAVPDAASGVQPVTPDTPARLRPALVRRLNDWLRRIAKKGAKFTVLPIETQHDVRKQVKNLRYCLDFSEGVLSRSSLLPLKRLLAEIQEELGDLNDFYVAEEHYRRLVDRQPQAWFAVGWLRAMQAHQRTRAQGLFRKLGKLSELKG